MYKDFYQFTESPFSIVPSARFLFLSHRHREALAQLQSGLSSGGGLALLTGEVGTGKTTVSRALLAGLKRDVQAGLILNPTFTRQELLASICDEFSIPYQAEESVKQLSDAIYHFLLSNHAKGIQTLLVIDEAQHLTPDVLEHLRLLTNLETDSQKLLKVLLIGQPELQHHLQQDNLRQLAQRITARYHLLPLTADDVSRYITFRLQVAGCHQPIFSTSAMHSIAKITGGVPRLINLVCDESLQLGYRENSRTISKKQVAAAGQKVMEWQGARKTTPKRSILLKSVVFSFVSLLLATLSYTLFMAPKEAPPTIKAEIIEPAVIENIDRPDYLSDGEIMALVQQSGDTAVAMQTLYRIWGYEVDIDSAQCRNGIEADLYCMQGNKGLNDLREFNRPAMVTLTVLQHPFYAVLFALDGDAVELLVADQRVKIPLEWFEAHWGGEFTLLWHSPIGSDKVLKYGQQDDKVMQFDLLLALVMGERSINTDHFSEALLERVKIFQQQEGLEPDGMVGLKTLIALDRLLNLQAPKLEAMQ
jgi:general secretion pathway protein A